MKQDVSEILGEGRTAQGDAVKVYRALRPLLCEKCGREITEGELFTRWPIAQQRVRIMPRCRTCVPFEEMEEKKEEQPSSPLIRELLGAEPAVETAQEKPSKQEVASAVEERLGPTLRWTRRTRK
jgi:hypothetical protein